MKQTISLIAMACVPTHKRFNNRLGKIGIVVVNHQNAHFKLLRIIHIQKASNGFGNLQTTKRANTDIYASFSSHFIALPFGG